MAERSLEIEGIFEEELYTCPRLMPVVVAKLNGTKTDLTRVFQATKHLPHAGELKHLRRIRDLPNGDVECIVCRYLAGERDSGEFLRQLESSLEHHQLLREFRVMEVPESAPQTELQRKATSSIWPCKYARNDYFNSCLACNVFSEQEKLILKLIVECSLKFMAESEDRSHSVAVVFRDAKIYGVGSTNLERVNKNMTVHSCMVAIDQVAKNLGGGHWKDLEEISLFEKLRGCLDGDDRLKGAESFTDPKPYLCTNYDIFVTEEPCFMCLMGLVQSRIRRLFYLDKGFSRDHLTSGRICFPDGAIEKHRMHRDRRLNHRFEAWRIKVG